MTASPRASASLSYHAALRDNVARLALLAAVLELCACVAAVVSGKVLPDTLILLAVPLLFLLGASVAALHGRLSLAVCAMWLAASYTGFFLNLLQYLSGSSFVGVTVMLVFSLSLVAWALAVWRSVETKQHRRRAFLVRCVPLLGLLVLVLLAGVLITALAIEGT